MLRTRNLDGPQVDLGQMLAARDAGVAKERELLRAHPGSVLIHMSMRIPGPVKTGARVEAVFDQAEAFLARSQADRLLDERVNHLPTGPVAYMVVRGDLKSLKTEMLTFENEHDLCDLLDVDVMELEHDGLVQLSRRDLGLGPRACLICGGDAKVCSRSRRHGLERVLQVVEAIVDEGWK
ncbi:2'-(5''-triphosphoribosyl)-3'-dephospho-CoA:apo- citrate lyase [Bifidobacterium actinocoloniiforme DSM 22766]|uniref:citrate lyase holo-[acyl-carrier protein] synthase n=1 Tax=Bifidobacterium actinocoloniiforme DSM 22766 TaxID=1437605 RepID=A0A086YYN3_9BIFI|nr:citrate lyase holo-[acyl-carrier protein] synthase [Bifidobacterium actinocoloniiforme]AKV55906.1 2-(5'-triphosphoribosyl)-3'-dephospho CoA synthase [Bifidobacterium actinocoloniiforme DSM 22766]KFI39383.1 2'-(5''-triphosphoribosyl)-3'-dephospho-CoA:apo- citrate lyase [Bifidobacterium actinocoloniiforme DSM 22766]